MYYLFIILIIILIIIFTWYYITYIHKEYFGDGVYGASAIVGDRNNICSVYINSFANARGDITNQTQFRFFNWCEEYKNVTNHYPSYRTAELAFNKLIKNGDLNI